MKVPPTQEQQLIIDQKLGPGEMMKVVAFAGSGKTTMYEGYAEARAPHPLLYLVFTKSNKEEARRKFPSHVQVETVHSLAYKAVGHRYKRSEEEGIASNVSYASIAREFHCDYYMGALISHTLNNWFNSADLKITHDHVEPDRAMRFRQYMGDQIIERANIVWKKMVEGDRWMGMTHNGYLKLYQLEKQKIPVKAIMYDEAQDTNPVSMEIVLRQALDYNTRVVLAGDPFQQIFAWRGAVDALDKVDCPTFYLTQSFRFGQAVADVANSLLGHYFQPEKKILGFPEIQSTLVDQFPAEEGRTIITRTNGGAFEQMIRCTDAGHYFYFTGDLKQLSTSILDVYYKRQGQNDWIEDRKIKQFRTYKELVEMATLDGELSSRVCIVERYRERIPSLIEKIKRASTSQYLARVIITTAHKAKGLEWDNVEIDNDFPELIDQHGAPKRLQTPADDPEKDPVISAEEINLLYVAFTRAKRNLCVNYRSARLFNIIAPGLVPNIPEPPKSLYEVTRGEERVFDRDSFSIRDLFEGDDGDRF